MPPRLLKNLNWTSSYPKDFCESSQCNLNSNRCGFIDDTKLEIWPTVILEKKVVEKAIKLKKKQIKKQQVLDEISSEEEIIVKKKEKPVVKKTVDNITVRFIPYM